MKKLMKMVKQFAKILCYISKYIKQNKMIIFITDELMLIKIRPIPINENLSAEILKGPDEEIVLQITKDLPIRNPPKPISFLPCPADVNIHIHV